MRSSVTGIFAGYVSNSAGNRTYPFTFTINSANTFEQKSVTIAGDTTGTWLTNNGVGIELGVTLGAGSAFNGTVNTWAAAEYLSVSGTTNLMATSGATFYITGVQLEKGSAATPFEFRSIGTELALCQRYAWSLRGDQQQICNGLVRTSSLFVGVLQFPVTMRGVPSLTVPNTAGYFNVSWGSSDTTVPTLAIGFGGGAVTESNVLLTASGLSATVGFGAVLSTNNANSYVLLSAEL